MAFNRDRVSRKRTTDCVPSCFIRRKRLHFVSFCEPLKSSLRHPIMTIHINAGETVNKINFAAIYEITLRSFDEAMAKIPRFVFDF
ncbi:MAG: hypothetical protein COB10_12450 [Planctomycetota bacterium]|nr:MAG: hypothetical protein COB10_12450 [Planctomycetota bacterium]